MDTRNLHPGVVAAVIVVVVAIVGFFIWRGTSAQTYNGPPIDMGAAMQAGKGAPPPPGPGGAGR